LFGIQARGGCSCAGPYGQVSQKILIIITFIKCVETQALLNINDEDALQYVMGDSNEDGSLQSMSSGAKERELTKCVRNIH